MREGEALGAREESSENEDDDVEQNGVVVGMTPEFEHHSGEKPPLGTAYSRRPSAIEASLTLWCQRQNVKMKVLRTSSSYGPLLLEVIKMNKSREAGC